MSLVPARCPQCGAQLQVDNTQDAAVCTGCGIPFIVSKAIENYDIEVNNAEEPFDFCPVCHRREENMRICPVCNFKMSDYSEALQQEIIQVYGELTKG